MAANEKLIIGLSVGIPLFALVFLGTGILVVICRKKSSGTSMTSWDDYLNTMPKGYIREGEGVNTGAADMSTGSGYQNTNGSKTPPNEYEPMFGSESKDNLTKGPQPANFSWDFLDRAYPNRETFKIQRPKLT
ncbi:unnamed protein product [Lymnaea stagnalis]|uniref:Uncharacterized protein n=1 Tax=Lymnaea stagnalis TaxID=6523 RepID=A0AAV2HPJ4_LYMST